MRGNEEERRRRRISITKLQWQTAVAAELIALCQTVTEDGHLEDQEIGALRKWLDENRGADLPAVAFLAETVESILADGKVTAAERQALYRAIETVLPPDIRESVRGARMSRQDEIQAQARELKDSTKQTGRKTRALRLADRWDFMVAGCLYEGRPEVIQRFAEPGHTVFLARDAANKFSRNAIEVRLSNGMQIGYVPEEHAVDIAPLLDRGYKHKAHIKKILAGRRAPIPVVLASLYLPSTETTMSALAEPIPSTAVPIPTGESTPANPKSGCLTVIAIVLAAMACITLFVLLR